MSNLLSIAVSGLNDAVLRAANAAANIVNASSTSKLPPSSGGAYAGFEPQDVVTLPVAGGGAGLGATSTVQPRNPSYVTALDPSSPNANAQGLVAAPNVDLNAELISSKEAQVSYGADAAVIKIDEKMQKSLLDALS